MRKTKITYSFYCSQKSAYDCARFLLLVYCVAATTTTMSSTTGKRKEIYKYLAPWPLYSMNWSVRPDKRFRLALGSFIEEYNNKVQIISLDEETSEFSAKR